MIRGKHKELNNTCAFFQRKLSIRAKNRRDTATSNASTETFKTAASQLDVCIHFVHLKQNHLSIFLFYICTYLFRMML